MTGDTFGFGTEVSARLPPVGQVIISLEATDSKGLNSSAQILLTVNP
jgi:hypothetical protein